MSQRLGTSFEEMVDNLDEMPITLREYVRWPSRQWTTIRPSTDDYTTRSLRMSFSDFYNYRNVPSDGVRAPALIVMQFRRWIRRAIQSIVRRARIQQVLGKQVLGKRRRV